MWGLPVLGHASGSSTTDRRQQSGILTVPSQQKLRSCHHVQKEDRKDHRGHQWKKVGGDRIHSRSALFCRAELFKLHRSGVITCFNRVAFHCRLDSSSLTSHAAQFTPVFWNISFCYIGFILAWLEVTVVRVWRCNRLDNFSLRYTLRDWFLHDSVGLTSQLKPFFFFFVVRVTKLLENEHFMSGFDCSLGYLGNMFIVKECMCWMIALSVSRPSSLCDKQLDNLQTDLLVSSDTLLLWSSGKTVQGETDRTDCVNYFVKYNWLFCTKQAIIGMCSSNFNALCL